MRVVVLLGAAQVALQRCASMAKELLCDQCGKGLVEEDFAAGRAVRDRADVFCAECASMYEEDERKQQMQGRMAEAAKALASRPRRGATTAIRRGSTTAIRTRAKGARTSARPTSRTAARAGTRRETAAPTGGPRASRQTGARPASSNHTTFYAVAGLAAAIAVSVIVWVLVSQ